MFDRIKKPQGQYVSGRNIDALLDILLDYRELTLSRSHHARATELIVELGGTDRLEVTGESGGTIGVKAGEII